MAFVLEFVGLPGSGKSTLKRQIANVVSKVNKPVYDNDYFASWVSNKFSFLEKMKVTLKHIFWLSKGYFLFIALADKNQLLKIEFHKWVRRTLMWTIYLHKFVKSKNKNDLVLLDQGIIQNIWAVFVGHSKGNIISGKAIENILEHLVKVETNFLFINIGVEESAKRVSSRLHGNSRFDKMTLEQTFAAIENEAEFMCTLRDVLIKSDFPLRQINGMDHIEKNTSLVISWMAQNYI